MSIWETDKLVLFIAFVIPGFISIKVYELLFPTNTSDSTKQVIDAIAYSCINYAILLFPILAVEKSGISDSCPTWYGLFYTFVLLIFPVLLAFFWRWIRSRESFQKNVPHPTAKPWDYVFSRRQWFWIIATLKNGEKIAGKYASNSFTSSYPAKEQIYLEEAWVLNDDGGFERSRNNTAGIIIVSDEISTIELFQYIP